MSAGTWKPEVFERLFQDNPDPWGFESSPYERQKLSRVLESLPASPIFFAVELGCAIGVGTLALAQHCGRVLAVDASENALAIAGRRCEGQEHVSFLKAFLPSDYPAADASGCDLVLISELLYFLTPQDIRSLAGMVMESLKSNGHILIVNWTGQTDTPCTGSEAAEYFIRACHERHWVPDLSEQGEGYRIDRLSRSGNSPLSGGLSDEGA
ncbi:methyltransferase domain-containing protein [Gluconobacter oxydans]|uniref:Methyltransferase domain-containing protein n=1 Tax=Gluconobacter oxydans TaxID=442 RepID=A0AB35APX2_GLUOY|nr:methyltransferase domain-containing protein [Gluconobacter oxydans]TCW24226.1 nodulation protein S (NodS) [Gluconobacter oxydans]